MNKKIIRALSVLISSAMLLPSVPAVMADGLMSKDDGVFSSYITGQPDYAEMEDSDTDFSLMAEQVGGHLVDLDYEDETIGSDAGLANTDALYFEVADGTAAGADGKVLKLGNKGIDTSSTKTSLATFNWGTGVGERVVVTSFSACSDFLASSEEAAFKLAGGNSAKNVTGGFKFHKGVFRFDSGTGTGDPSEKDSSPKLSYTAKQWYTVNLVSYVNSSDEITKTEYYIDGEKNGVTCVPNDDTAKKPDRFRVNLDRNNPSTAFYIDNLTVIDFQQEMNHIEDMLDMNSGIPSEVLGADYKITLPKKYMGADVTWTSSDTSIIDPAAADENGKIIVNHPDATKDVKLTASLIYKGAEGYEIDGIQIASSDTHEFTVSVDQSGPMSDETKLKYVLPLVTIDKTQVTESFTLPLQVVNTEKNITGTVTWTSDNDVIRVDGENAVVTRPAYNKNAATVKLTATVTVGEASDTKVFELTVPKRETPTTDEDKIAYAENQLLGLNFSENGTKVISSSINLPTEIKAGDDVIATIVWTSSDTAWLGNDGTLYQQPSSGTQKITLKAAVTSGAVTKTYNFEVALRAPASVKAFPGAQGYGTQTRGGAGGYIVHVTSLGATGPGTLYEALEEKVGARTIVFDVGGTIDLTPVGRALRMSGEDDSNVTIAGQTAPGEGIQLKGYGLTISSVHDVIIRNINIRIGNVRKAKDTYQSDPLSVSGGKRVVLDHLSMCWAIDMGFRASGQEVTMSNCMISKGLYWNTPHEKGKHNYAGIFSPKYGTFYGNYIADCGQRAPRINDNEYIDIRNNVVANSKYTFDICNYEWMGANTKFNIVNNVVLKGNPAPGGSTSNVTSSGSYKYFQGRTYSGGLFAYSVNNYDNTKNARPLNDTDENVTGALWTGDLSKDSNAIEQVEKEMYAYSPSGYSNMSSTWYDLIFPSDISLDEYDASLISKKGNTLMNYPFVVPSMNTYSAEDAAKYVLTNAGANAKSEAGGAARDILSRRYLAEGRTRLQILSDYSKASKTYGIKLDKSYGSDTAYGLPVHVHSEYKDKDGVTVYDVDGQTVADPSDYNLVDQYKFVSCADNDEDPDHLDSLYAIDKNGEKYLVVLRDYTDGDDIYDAFEVYDTDNNKLTKPSPYVSDSERTDGSSFNGGKILLKYAEWGDGPGNYDHTSSGITDGNFGTETVDTEWTEYDWPQLPTVYRDGSFDSNGDGIPNFFIKLMGWDKHPEYSPTKDISRLDFEGRGYTNLEYYINDYCAGDQDLEDSEENDPIEAENVRDGSSKFDTHNSHEILFNTARRAKAKLYYNEGEVFNMSDAKEINLSSVYDYENSKYMDANDFDTYFSAVLGGNGENALKPNTTYSYKIKTYSDTGVENMSSETYQFTTKTASSGKPGQPRVTKYIPFVEEKAVNGQMVYNGQITLHFEPDSQSKTYNQVSFGNAAGTRYLRFIGNNDYDTSTDHYILRYSTKEDLSDASEVIIPSTATSYILKGLSTEKKYYLDLRAVSADGTESESAVYNQKKAEQASGTDKDGNPIYSVHDIELSNDGKSVKEYYEGYDFSFSSLAIQPTRFVIDEYYPENLEESGITEGDTAKFTTVYGNEKDWYIYTLGGRPIPSSYNGSKPMLMLRDDNHDHGFTYAKKFDTLLDGKSTIRAKIMICNEELDPMNNAPEFRFYIQQDSADLGDTDSDVESTTTNDATAFGNIVTLQFTKNEILYNGTESIARYSDDVWYDLKILMDADTSTCSLYINDSLIGKDMEYIDSATSSSIARWQLSSRLTGKQDVYVESMYAYKGWDDIVIDPSATAKPDNTVQEGTSGSRPSSGGGGGGGGGAVTPSATSTPKPTEEPSVTDKPSTGDEPVKSVFTDMAGYEWAEEAVNELYNRGIAYGITDDLFAPEKEITRAEFITLLMRGFELIGNDAVCNFDDVPDGAWYYPAVAMAYSMGVVSGYSDNIFGANDNVSRQDMAAMIVRLMNQLGMSVPEVREYEGFADSDQISEYAADAVIELYKGGIINGVGEDCFDPQGTANRASAARMLYETLRIQWDKQAE